MNKIIFYKKANGTEPIKEYLSFLDKKTKHDKQTYVKYEKTIQYISFLETHGISIGSPIVKYLEDGVWELRPKNIRILFARLKDNTYILLHYFEKKTNKTPRKEIEQAKRNLANFLDKGDGNR